MTDAASPRIQIKLTPTQTELVDAFRAKEHLASRAEAVQLLLDIALDTVNASGRRFWDKPIGKNS